MARAMLKLRTANMATRSTALFSIIVDSPDAISAPIRWFGGKPSNKKKKRKLKRKARKTIEKEINARRVREEQYRLQQLRLNKMHDLDKWKRLVEAADTMWFTKENVKEHGRLRQYMLRCEAWCPIQVLLKEYSFQLNYWTNSETLVKAFQSDFGKDLYEVQNNQALWEQCYQRFDADLVDPPVEKSAEDEKEEYFPSTYLDNDDDITWKYVNHGEGSPGYGGTSGEHTDSDSDVSDCGYSDSTDSDGETSKRSGDEPSGDKQDAVAADDYQAEDDLSYDWRFTDREDENLVEESYEKDADGEEEVQVDEQYRFAMVRHKDIDMEFLQSIEQDNASRLQKLIAEHPYLYKDEAREKGWFQNRPTYDSSLVWDPKPISDASNILQSILKRRKN